MCIFFLICSSQSYMHKYLTNIEHDNAYVTRYYRKIDARRKRNGKHTLLPLKKIEKTKTIDLRSYRLVDRECDYLVGTTSNQVFLIPVALYCSNGLSTIVTYLDPNVSNVLSNLLVKPWNSDIITQVIYCKFTQFYGNKIVILFKCLKSSFVT